MSLSSPNWGRALATRSSWIALAAVVQLLAVRPAAAQNQVWIKQLGTGNWDEANAAAPDGSSGVFVTGYTEGNLGGPSAGPADAWLARYNSAGNLLWIRQLGTSNWDAAEAATPDGAGGVFVTGITGGNFGGPSAGSADAWLARYDSAGNQVWIRQLGTSANESAVTAALDGAGGVYVGGWTSGSLGGPFAGIYDAWLARYDGAGNKLWVRQLGTNTDDGAWAATPDGAGGVYVTGGTFGSLGGPNSGLEDAWLAHYNSSGSQLWIRQLGSNSYDSASAAAADGAGGLYVSGDTHGSLGGPFAGTIDAWLARYDSAGNQVWVRQLGTSGYDQALAAAEDGSGGAYVSGSTEGDLGGPNAGMDDVWLAHFGSSGIQLGIEQFGSSSGEAARAAAPDGSGGVYLSGYANGSLGGPSAGGPDAWLARHDGGCGSGTSYCSASSTSIPGCQASIGGTGSPSLANPSGFAISSGSVPGGNLGICFFGNNGFSSIPFGTLGGKICVQPPFFRTGPKPSGGNSGVCNGAYDFTLQDLINASPIVITGAVIHAEVWARDPANPDGFLLSNGLQFTVCQ